MHPIKILVIFCFSLLLKIYRSNKLRFVTNTMSQILLFEKLHFKFLLIIDVSNTNIPKVQ